MTGVAYPVSALTPASVPVLLILRKFTCCALLADGQQGRQQDQEEPHLTQSAAQVTTLEKFCRHSPARFPGARAGIAGIARIAGIAGIGGGNGYRG